jgi:hypothetical protein
MTGGSTATFKMVLLYSLMISTILFHRVSSFLEVTYKRWRASGAIEKLMTLLHEAIREQVKKKENGPL